jgi:hypothetical protein
MSTREAREKVARARLTFTLRRAGQTHERALLVELWAAEHYQRLGDVEAAQRRRDAAKQQATFAETATAASRTLRTQARRAPHHRHRPLCVDTAAACRASTVRSSTRSGC